MPMHAPSYITFLDTEIAYMSLPEALARFARSLNIIMNISETACLTLDVIVFPLLFGGNHII